MHRLPALNKPRMTVGNVAPVAPTGQSPYMETTATKLAPEKSTTPVALSATERPMPQGSASTTLLEKKLIGYGLPCSRCHAYYPADMDACPICQSPVRVSPTAPVVHSGVCAAPAVAAPVISGAPIDEERERLLKEIKSQAFASHTQINAAAAFQCVLKHQHSGATEPAAVCHSCYGEVRQKADLMEAALHMDVKDAEKIVYTAVWADTSNPNASYLNAAKALMAELHKRAGIGLLLGENKPLSH